MENVNAGRATTKTEQQMEAIGGTDWLIVDPSSYYWHLNRWQITERMQILPKTDEFDSDLFICRTPKEIE